MYRFLCARWATHYPSHTGRAQLQSWHVQRLVCTAGSGCLPTILRVRARTAEGPTLHTAGEPALHTKSTPKMQIKQSRHTVLIFKEIWRLRILLPARRYFRFCCLARRLSNVIWRLSNQATRRLSNQARPGPPCLPWSNLAAEQRVNLAVEQRVNLAVEQPWLLNRRAKQQNLKYSNQCPNAPSYVRQAGW